MKPYALGLYEKALPNNLNIEQKLAAARDAGYDFLEISIDETDEKLARLDWQAWERRKVAAASQSRGMPIRTMCLSGHRRFPLGSADASVRARSLSIMQKAVSLACDIGVQIIQLAGYDVFYEPASAKTRVLFLENLYKAVDMAARDGVILAFETMETPLINTVERAMRYVTYISSPYLQVYPDIGNITNALAGTPVTPADDLLRGRGHIVAMHLKETAPGVYRDMRYGEGHVDFAAAVRQAYALGVRRYVTEYWHDGSENYARRARDTCVMFHGIFDKDSKLMGAEAI